MKIKIASGRWLIKIASVVLCCSLASCGGYQVGAFGIATTRDVAFPVEKGTRVRGESCVTLIFIFPSEKNPTVMEAIEDALKKGAGDLLGDAVIADETWGIPFVLEQHCIIATGTILKLQHPKPVEPSPPAQKAD